MGYVNIRSVLVAAGDNGCTDGAIISSVIRGLYTEGYQGISEDWVKKCEKWSGYKPSTLEKYIGWAFEGTHWYGEVLPIPKKYLTILSGKTKIEKVVKQVVQNITNTESVKAPETPVVGETVTIGSSKKKMNLRTLLCNCYENQIFEAPVALGILDALSKEYEVSERDLTFSSNWKNWGVNTFKKMVENTYNGENGFARAPLLECDDFEKFIPLTQRTVEGEELNARTIFNKFWENKCTDGVAIAAALVDAQKAGYEGINYDYHNLIGKKASEVQKELDEAHNGKGVFSKENLLDNCPEF